MNEKLEPVSYKYGQIPCFHADIDKTGTTTACLITTGEYEELEGEMHQLEERSINEETSYQPIDLEPAN